MSTVIPLKSETISLIIKKVGDYEIITCFSFYVKNIQISWENINRFEKKMYKCFIYFALKILAIQYIFCIKPKININYLLKLIRIFGNRFLLTIQHRTIEAIKTRRKF